MDIEDPKITTTKQLRETVAQVSFERSCLDMGWEWQIAAVFCDDPAPSAGWLIRCSFQRPERDTGIVARGFGRWWFIEGGATVSGVQKTMFAAAKMIADHELMEAFKVDGLRPFDPHRTIRDLTGGAAR